MAKTPVLSIEGDHIRVPATVWTHHGFRQWVKSAEFPDQGIQASFIDEEVFLEISPDSIESHNKVKSAITAALLAIADDEDLGEVYAARALLTNVAAALSTEPDAMFASWDTLRDKRLRPIEWADHAGDFIELEGTPDLVVEVVSDASARKDLVGLRESYARAGIPEYWLVDARSDELSFEILVLQDSGYENASARAEPQRSAVLGRAFTLTRRRNRMGRWRYRLGAAG